MSFVRLFVVIGTLCAVVVGQEAAPPFTGVWTLNLQRSSIEAKHPPIASTARNRFDGQVWRLSRTHRYQQGKSDTWTTMLVVGSSKDRIERDPPLTSRSRMTRDGNALVLSEDFAADSGDKATNTVRYSLTDGGNTLVEDEREVTPDGSEHNVWVLERQANR